MKKIIILLAAFFLIYSGIYSQELFEITSTRSMSNHMNEFLGTRIYKKAFSGKINLGVTASNTIMVTLPEVGTVNYIETESDEHKWVGETDDQIGSLIIIKNEGSLIGTVTYGTYSYQINSLDGNQGVMFELDFEDLPQDACDMIPVNTSVDTDSYSDNIMLASYQDQPLKVLVAYTASAEQAIYTDVKSFVQLAVEETNRTYRNSLVWHTVELAACVKVNYSESSGNFTNHVDRYTGISDGYMDEIHNLRNLYAADVCVLIVNDPQYCGVAKAIKATATTAFCVVHYSCATGYYSFAHEIGHLQAARHDRGVDPSSSPHKDGHGYISPNKNWRTVMAYANDCNGCVRIPYWSNPNVRYPLDNFPMGTTNYENNARVLNAETNTMKAFRNISSSLTLNQTVVNNVKYGDSRANSSIQTSGNMTIANSNELRMQAPVITLKPGFVAALGSKVVARSAAALSDSYDDLTRGALAIEKNKLMLYEGINIYPNPTNGIVNLDIPSEMKVSNIEVHDMMGRVMMTNTYTENPSEIDLTGKSAGMYIIRIYYNGGLHDQKIILK